MQREQARKSGRDSEREAGRQAGREGGGRNKERGGGSERRRRRVGQWKRWIERRDRQVEPHKGKEIKGVIEKREGGREGERES